MGEELGTVAYESFYGRVSHELSNILRHKIGKTITWCHMDPDGFVRTRMFFAC